LRPTRIGLIIAQSTDGRGWEQEWAMVKQVEVNGKVYHVCEFCNCAYSEKEYAEQCQEWCKEYHRCNMKIMKHRVDLDKIDQE
jgi:hypothetical protein